MRVARLLPGLVVTCLLGGCGRSESRLDPLLAAQRQRPPDATAPDEPDETDLELERKLRDVAARPGTGAGSVESVPLAQVLGSRPAPFGPLEPARPGMTPEEILKVIPTAQAAGSLLWVPTGVAGVTAEMLFDGEGRLRELRYHIPLAERPTLVRAWGAPTTASNAWLEDKQRWRIELGEDAIKGKIELSMRAYTPFAVLLDHVRYLGDAPPAMPTATDLCKKPTHLVPDPAGRGVRLYQCYDRKEAHRRDALAMMEQRWGAATPTRTADDRPVFAWTLPDALIEAQPTFDPIDDEWAWEIAIRPRD